MTFSAEAINTPAWLAAIAVGVIAWLVRRSIERVDRDLSGKADKDYMQREIESLKIELRDTREARDRDLERLERTNAEKFAEFTASVRDRLGTMERNVDAKLDMILQVVKQLRKE